MLLPTSALLLGISALAHTAQGLNIVLSNDDGWAEINIRAFYRQLVKDGHSVVLSAPADNRSGTGSSDAPVTPVVTSEFNSVPAGSPAEGFNASMPRFNYVNSFPVTAMRYGIQTLAPKFFKKQPIDIAVAGFNVGANAGTTVMVSGTVGATTEAALEGLSAIAFSGVSGSQEAWTTRPVPQYVQTYAHLSNKITQQLVTAPYPTPYMQKSNWINVNFPTSNDTTCTKPGDFKFIFTRIMTPTDGEKKDIKTCNNVNGYLPVEQDVLDMDGCYVTISVGNAKTKKDVVKKTNQAYVQRRLAPILTCFPGT